MPSYPAKAHFGSYRIKPIFIPWAFLSAHLLCYQPSTSKDAHLPPPNGPTLAQMRNYVKTYTWLAKLEMVRGGVPASIKLAQAILESDAGTSELASNANNHFGIKCGAKWSGERIFKFDDDLDPTGQPVESCFRVYSTIRESYVSHTEFLRDPDKAKRYGNLFVLSILDYQAWARGLQTGGYATDSTYADRLIEIIELLELYKIDLQVYNQK